MLVFWDFGLEKGGRYAEKGSYAGADHQQAQDGRSRAVVRENGCPGLQEDRGNGADLLPVAQGIRWDAHRAGQALEGS